MSSQPLISVCIPCYNGGAFIADTVHSVLTQSLADFELVVVDDASSDDTMAVLEQVQDSRIRLIRNEQNVGMGNNWNLAVSHSRGKYVKLLCGDDVLYPYCLERQALALESPENTRAVLAICDREVINSQGKVVLRRKVPIGRGLVSGAKLIRTSIRYGSNIIGEPVTGLFRRAVLDQGVRFRPDNPYCIDLAFWTDVLRHGQACVQPERLAAFRISTSAVSARIGFRQAQAFRRFARGLHRDPAYRVNKLDLAMACLLSFQWCVLRNLFLKLRGGHPSKRGPLGASACAGLTKARSAAELESLCE